MDDEEIGRLLKRTDREFRALHRRMVRGWKSKSDFIFTLAEEAAWTKAEPNFPKPIVKPYTTRR